MQPLVAILCPEPRLRRILRLSLLADDQQVVEWSGSGPPARPTVDAVVADLDSLGRDVASLSELLRVWGIADDVPMLLISVYPLDLRDGDGGRLLDALQPPFAPQDLAARARHLTGA